MAEYQLEPSPTRANYLGHSDVPGYGEGLWTPAVGGTATYTAQSGKYTKIGNTVFVTCLITINILGTGSATTISGLPFLIASGISGLISSFYVGSANSLATAVISFQPIGNAGARSITIYSRASADANDQANNLFGNGASIYLAGHYHI